MTREFFKAVQEKLPRTSVNELRSPQGNPIKQQKDIEEACISFYEDLYTSPARDNLTCQSKQEILDTISHRISPLTASALSLPLSKSELHKAACALAKEKAPGSRWHLSEFFHCVLVPHWRGLLPDGAQCNERRSISKGRNQRTYHPDPQEW